MQSSGNAPYENGYGPRVAATVDKFGANAAVVATGLGSTVWGHLITPSPLYVWPTAPSVATIASSTGIADAGVKVVIDGLDGVTGYFRQMTITLDAAGQFVTTETWWAGWRIALADDSPAVFTGNVTMTVDGKIVAIAGPDDQQTRQLVYQIPYNQVGFINRVNLDVGKNDEAEGYLVTQALGAPGFRLRDNYHLFGSWPGRKYGRDGAASDGLICMAGTRIELRALAATGTDNVTGYFLLSLFDL